MFSILFIASGIGFAGFLGIIAFIAATIGLSAVMERKRRDALRGVAESLKLEFFPKAEGFDPAALSPFALGGRGRSRRARNLMRSEAQGVGVEIFDYSFTVGSGKNSSTVRSSVARFRAPDLGVPHFQLQPEGLFTKLGAALGMQDIDFPAHPKFSNRQLLKGKDEAAIRRLFDDELITSLENFTGVTVEGAGNQLIVYRSGKTSKPELIRSFFEEAFRLFTRFSDAGQRTGFASKSTA